MTNRDTKRLYIIGAGGFGREVAETVREINRAATGNFAPLITGGDFSFVETMDAPPPCFA
jgi:hypothetical protein